MPDPLTINRGLGAVAKSLRSDGGGGGPEPVYASAISRRGGPHRSYGGGSANPFRHTICQNGPEPVNFITRADPNPFFAYNP